MKRRNIERKETNGKKKIEIKKKKYLFLLMNIII